MEEMNKPNTISEEELEALELQYFEKFFLIPPHQPNGGDYSQERVEAIRKAIATGDPTIALEPMGKDYVE